VSERCMCGDPECGNCFPRWDSWADIDEDAAYEEHRQIEIDAELFEKGAEKG